MLLRESSKKENLDLNLVAVTADGGEVGLQNENELFAVAEAVFDGDEDQMGQVRSEVEAVLGPQALVDAIGVAAAFNGITKIANATGLPLDSTTNDRTVEIRQLTGIDNYSEQSKVQQFG